VAKAEEKVNQMRKEKEPGPRIESDLESEGMEEKMIEPT